MFFDYVFVVYIKNSWRACTFLIRCCFIPLLKSKKNALSFEKETALCVSSIIVKEKKRTINCYAPNVVKKNCNIVRKKRPCDKQQNNIFVQLLAIASSNRTVAIPIVLSLSRSLALGMCVSVFVLGSTFSVFIILKND